MEYKYRLLNSLREYYFPKKIHVRDNIYLEYKHFGSIFINNVDINMPYLKNVLKYIFKDQIIIFMNNRIYNNTLSSQIYNYENCKIKLKKHHDFLIIKTYFDDSNFFVNHYLNCFEFNSYINKEQIDKINKINKINNNSIIRKINRIDNNYYNKIVNFDNSVKVYYDYFVNMFNDYDKNIIYIGLYGKSATGKTMFLRNIINILEIYNKEKYSINNLYSNLTYYQISRNLIRFITTNYYQILVIICTTDDFSNDIFQKIKEIKDTQYINIKKIIILFETIEYTDYFNDFDITFETKYQSKITL